MKKSLILVFSLFTVFIYGQNSGLLNDFKLDKERSFIQNKGQFNGRNWQKNEIVYALDNNPFYIFFTEKGITYRFDKIIKNPNRKSEHSDEGSLEPKRVNISELVHATWIAANEDVEIIAEERVDFHYSYAVKNFATGEVSNIPGINGFNKITYKNLYDNIDVEYRIHPEGGVKYSVILHPGADPSQVQLQYHSSHTNTKDEKIEVNLNTEGQLKISTSLGDIIEHAPYTFYKGTEESIGSAYHFENNILSFDLDQYDNSKEVVIDPWVLSPNFNTSTAVWEVETDGVGNVYAIGGETPMELRKYNAAGTQQWIYVTPWDTNSVWLGTMATDDLGTTYITSGTSPEIERVDNAGNMVWHANGTGLSTEYWSITFNCDNSKLIVGGTSGGLFSWDATIFDIDINNGSVLSQQNVGTQGGLEPVEVRSISSSKNAKYIYLTHTEVGAINQNIGACPTDAPYFEVDNGHHLGYKCENYLPATQNGGGLKALVANDLYFYTHDGENIHQRALGSGALINSVAVPGGNNQTFLGEIVVHNSGLDVDDCGNVYVGSTDRVVKYDANLNYISEAATGFAVYDVSVNSNGEVLAVGAEQDNGSTNRIGHIASVNLTACSQYALVCCDANICPQDTLCETDPFVNLVTTTGGGTFSGTGITDPTAGTFDPAVAGAGTHTISYSLTCGSDQIEVVVSPCTSLDVCVETNGDLTVTSGTGPFDWDEQVTTQDCSACVFGCNFPAGCAVNVNTWQYFTSGTTITPPGFPMQVTDVNGSTLIITDPNNLPACATACDPTISAAGPFCETDPSVNLTAVDPGGTWSGTGITNATAGTFDPATAGVGTHTITYSLTCGSSDTEDIVVNPLDDASFSYAQGTYCLTDTDPMPTITGLAGGTFSIDNSGSINSSTGVIDLDASGSGSYVVTYTTNGNCPNTATFNITITTGADATISAAGPFCETDPSVNLTAVDGGGTWSGTGITDATAGTFDPATAGAGMHTITYEITGSCGDIDTEDITVNPSDDASFSYSQGSYCLSDPNPTPTVTGLTGGTFTIDNGGIINAGTGEIDIAGSGAGSYTITYTTNGPCPETATFSVTLTTGADATISTVGPFCETDPSVNLTAVDGGGTWSGTGITDATAGTFDPATAGAGTHTITYEITGSCGDIDTEDITVNPLDDASFSYAVTTFCVSDTDPSATINGLNGGTFTIDNGGVINASTGVIDLDASGAGSYQVTYLTNGPCPNSSLVSITITNSLDATIAAAGPFCENDPALNLVAADAGGTWTGNGITNASTGTFDPSVAGAGTHTITYTIPGACGSSDNIDIVVNSVNVAAFAYPSTTFCADELNPSPGIMGALGGTFSVDNGGVINPVTGELDLQQTGSGTFTVTYITPGPCADTATQIITINPASNASISAVGPMCIYDNQIVLSASPGGGIWSGSGIIDSLNGTFDPDTAGVGVHEIIYVISGACGDSDTINIVVNSAPIANVTPNISVNYGSSVTLEATGGGTYLWTPDTDLSCSDCSNPEASPLEETTYCVVVADSGCTDTACTTVSVNLDFDCAEVFVPTAFTPGSGDENSLECVLGGCITQLHFKIYNRWGELLFETFDQSVCWDGTHRRNGEPVSSGVYVYILEATMLNGEEVELKGNVSLIR